MTQKPYNSETGAFHTSIVVELYAHTEHQLREVVAQIVTLVGRDPNALIHKSAASVVEVPLPISPSGVSDSFLSYHTTVCVELYAFALSIAHGIIYRAREIVFSAAAATRDPSSIRNTQIQRLTVAEMDKHKAAILAACAASKTQIIQGDLHSRVLTLQLYAVNAEALEAITEDMWRAISDVPERSPWATKTAWADVGAPRSAPPLLIQHHLAAETLSKAGVDSVTIAEMGYYPQNGEK